VARLRPQHPVGPLAAALVFAVFAGQAGTALAQSSDAALMRPQLDGDARNPPRFRKPTFGNPPAFGAGTSGFDSSNRRKMRGGRTAPGSSGPARAQNLPPVNVRPIEATLAPVYKQPLRPVLRSPYPQASRDPALAGGLGTDPNALVARPVRQKAEEDPFAPVGYRMGTFILRPAVEINGGHDSNVPRSTTPTGSSLLTVAPELQINSDWSRHQWNTMLRGGYTWYQQLPSFDKPNIDLKTNARIDISSQTRANLEGRFGLAADNPADPNLPSGTTKPPLYTTYGAVAGVTQQFNRLELTAKGTFDRLNYQDDTTSSSGTAGVNCDCGTTAGATGSSTVNLADRNYNQYGGALRGAYEWLAGIKPFVEVGADTRIHDHQYDVNGVQRDSTGQYVKAGSMFELTRKLTGEFSLGYLQRHYKDPTLNDISAPTIDASLIYTATPLTTIKLDIKSTVVETIISNTSGQLTRDFSVQVDHSFRRWLVGSLKFGYGLDDYQGLGRQDKRYVGSAALTYKLSRTAQIRGEFRQERLRSNVSGVDYTANIIMFGLRLQR
jgi:hypothetical protein